MNEPILTLENLNIAYSTRDGALKSVEDLSLSFESGKVTGIIGESGCGKTTLINSVMGVLASNATVTKKSKIFFKNDKRNILNFQPETFRKFRWRKASMIFQAAQNAMNPTLTIYEQLMDSIWDHQTSMTQTKAEKKITNLLKMVRLNPERVLNSYPHELSGGMRQRVIIAMALVLDPELLILDEPTTALDMITQSFVFDILVDLQQSQNLSMILITHDLTSAAKLAHNMVIMYGGEVMETADSESLFKNPIHPYTKGLLGAIPFIDGDVVTKKSIEGSPPDLINKTHGCIFHERCPNCIEQCRFEKPQLVKVDEHSERKIACFNPGDN